MEDNSEKKKLNKLGIFSSEQLEFNSLNFWWQKKYKEIQNNIELENPEESLIEINNFRDELIDNWPYFLRFFLIISLDNVAAEEKILFTTPKTPEISKPKVKFIIG